MEKNIQEDEEEEDKYQHRHALHDKNVKLQLSETSMGETKNTNTGSKNDFYGSCLKP